MKKFKDNTNNKFLILLNKYFNEKVELIIAIILTLFLLILFLIMISIQEKSDLTSLYLKKIINSIPIQIIMCLVAIIVQFIFGRKYYINAYKELFKWKTLGMNTLISSSTFISFIYSFILMFLKFFDTTKFNSYETMFESGATIITITMIGDLITDGIRKKVSSDLTDFEYLKESFIFLFKDNAFVKTNINEAKIGDVISVSRGSKIPLDGKLLSKSCLINESILTGESKPVVKYKNNYLMSGSINIGDTITIQVTKLFKESYLNQIIEKVEELQSQKIKLQKIADKISKYFIWAVFILSVVGFLVQFFFGGIFHNWYINLNLNYLITWNNNSNGLATGYVSFEQLSQSIYIFITVLIIACPCSLGLAAPLAIAVGSSKAAKQGILINNIDAFEKMKLVNAICFDKTGTLTTGNFVVEKIIGNEKNLNLIYQLESKSLHPIAKSYINWYLLNNKLNSSIELEEKFIKEIAGIGIIYNNKKTKYTITSFHYAKENNFIFNDKLLKDLKNLNNDKLYSYIVFSKNDVVESIVILSDEIRQNVSKTIRLFNKLKIKTYLITGDNKKTTDYLSKHLNFTKVYSETSPDQKANIVKELKEDQNFIAFVGDGLNDVLALEESDLKIVMNEGSEIAKSISDIILIKNDIYNVYKAIKITLEIRKFVIFNLFWAFGYNAIAIPLAIFGFVNPMLAAVIMSLSSISVLVNSLLFKIKNVK